MEASDDKKKVSVKIFQSYEEMNHSDIEEMASIPPEERIRNTVNLILRAYGVTREELNLRKNKTKVTILRSS